MALPAIIAAIPAVVSAVQQLQRSRVQARSGGGGGSDITVTGSKGISTRSSTGTRGSLDFQLPDIGSGNPIPFIPSPSQFKSGMEKYLPKQFGQFGGYAGQQQLPSGRKKYRRMNVTNVKALRRAGRRVDGFVRLAKQLITMHQKHHIKPRKRRR